jgi:glycosyltransferase involved in cell wall biosynthesis
MSGEQAVQLSMLIPVYNEADAVQETVAALAAELKMLFDSEEAFEIIAIDDGSTDGSGEKLAAMKEHGDIRLLRQSENRGYGAALKAGASVAHGEWLGMIDADGTYPVDQLPELWKAADTSTGMMVGARTGSDVNIPLIRRPAKWFLRRLAGYLTDVRIPDLNSGMRLVRRELFEANRRLYPDGFSLTTTITLALLTQGHPVKFHPINYAKRVGSSSIRPIRDTLKFFGLILRTVLYFNPLKVFGPASVLLIAAGIATAIVSKFYFGRLMDVTSITLVMTGVQVLAIGLLADLIDKRL